MPRTPLSGVCRINITAYHSCQIFDVHYLDSAARDWTPEEIDFVE